MSILAHISTSLAIPTVLSTIRSLFRTVKQQNFLLSIDLPIEKWCKGTRENDRFRDIGRNSPLVGLGWLNSRERPSNKFSPFKYISLYIYHYIINKIEVNIYAKRFKSGGTIIRKGIYMMLDDLLWLMVNLLHSVPIVSDVEPSFGYITRPGTTRQNPKGNRRISLSVWCCAYIAHTKYGRPIISTDARVKNMATRNKIGTRPKETPVDIQTYIVPPSPHHAHLKKKN